MKMQFIIQRSVVVIFAAVLAACLCGCGRSELSSNAAASNSSGSGRAASTNSPASNNQNNSGPLTSSMANANASTAPKSSSATPELVGTYQLQEVHKEGVVGVMSEYKTSITFNRDSTYSRVSTRAGKSYHTDTGDFKIVPPKKLILSLKLSDRNIQHPPKERTNNSDHHQDSDRIS